MRIAIASVLLFLSAGSGLAQTRASGPWWPNPTWGAGDQAGASNWITPEKIVEAVRLVKTGKVYEIGQVYEKGMPLFGQRTFTLLVGSDQSGTEVQPSADATQAYPVHQELMMKNGIYNLENLTLEELSRDGVSEFLFVFTPVRFKGATGSPGRPIAIR